MDVPNDTQPQWPQPQLPRDLGELQSAVAEASKVIQSLEILLPLICSFLSGCVLWYVQTDCMLTGTAPYRAAVNAHSKVRVVGSGHSFNPLYAEDGEALISLCNMAGQNPP